ncbi:MAG TPA: 30S ribosome-binding factor RbfA [Aestuariivirgaceae bacterium]|nr:30S ribosome-binding factor RbfA [Aestuariivirgaceae bacterium]
MSGSAPSQRQLRVGELIRHALAQIFSRGETGDPVVERLGVTVLEVTVSPDMRIATVYVRPFMQAGGEDLIAALERNRRYVRGLITPMLKMKFMPELRFRLDTSLDYATHVDELLARPDVRRDTGDGGQS